MAEKKSILEEAMLDIKSIQNALNANTKEMLRSVAKEEIDSVVKESLNVEVYEEEDVDTQDDEFGGGGDGSDSLGDIEAPTDDLGMGGAPGPEGMGGEEPGMGDEMGGPDMGQPEMGMDTDVLGGDDMDMTSASDDEVMAVFKRLSGSDEIEIVGDEIHMNISEPGEYIVKMNGGTPGGEEGMGGMEAGMGGDEEGLGGLEDMGGDEEGGEDVDYEIEMGDDEEGGDTEPTDDTFGGDEEGGEEEGGDEGGEEEEEETESLEEEMEEETDTLEEKIQVGKGRNVTNNKTSIRGAGGDANNVDAPNVTAPNRTNETFHAKKVLVETAQKYNALLTEAMKLKAENEEFRTALKDFRTKLVETVIFNSNLTYATKLFLEHSTTKSEKDTIIKRFDEITSLTESKRLYKTIANELKIRKPISEALESKIIKESTTSTSSQLNESTAYVDPSTQRIKDLIKRVENR
jgi:hypothetical protein